MLSHILSQLIDKDILNILVGTLTHHQEGRNHGLQVKRLVEELFHPAVAFLMEVFPPHVDPDHQVEGGLDIHVPLSGRGLYGLPGLLVHQGRLAH